MHSIAAQISNPFGLRPPFDVSDEGDVPAVPGYGDPNADVHVIGDHPGSHGGTSTGVPFTDSEPGRAIQRVLRAVGLLDGPRDRPTVENCFLSYIHMCTPPRDRSPDPAEYDRLERYFDAELRAVNAHILVPVGERATDRVLRSYTNQRDRLTLDLEALHATEVRGRGFLVVPLSDPETWDEAAADSAVARLEAILDRDYRQTKGVATRVG